MAAGAIVRLVGRLGEEKATKALKVLVSAKRAPVVVHEILASAAVLFDAKFGWAHSAADLVTVVRSKSIDQWRRQVAAHSDVDHRMQLWKAVAQGWVRAGNRMAA